MRYETRDAVSVRLSDYRTYTFSYIEYFDMPTTGSLYTVIIYHDKNYVGTIWPHMDPMFSWMPRPDDMEDVCKYISIWLRSFSESMTLQEWIRIYTDDTTSENI